MARRILCFALVALIPLALLEAWWVAPSRADGYKQMDFAVFYTAGRMFAHGADPYDRAAAEGVWIRAGGDDDLMDMFWGGPFYEDPDSPLTVQEQRAAHWLPVEVVPPGLTVMAPFSVLPAELAWVTWNVVVGILFVGQLYATVRLMRRPLWDPASLAVILFTVLLEPLHIGLANGQPSVPTISLIVLSLYWAISGRSTAAGVAFAVAVALKPPLAAPFVLLFMYQGKWRTVVVAAVVGLVLTLAAAVPMQIRNPHWVHSWASQVRSAEGAGNIDSAQADNPGRNDLLNVALIAHLLVKSVPVVTAVCMTLYAGAVAALFYVNRRRRESLGVTAAFAVLSLLPMYHRYYDAGVIVLAIGWGMTNLRGRTRWVAAAVLAVSAAYVVPSEWLVGWFRDVTHVDPKLPPTTIARYHEIADSHWFNDLAQPHHAWELLAVVGCLFAGAYWLRNRPEPPQVPGPLGDGVWQRNRLRIGVALLIPFAVVEGWWVSYDRDYYKELDFGMYYTAARMFVEGGNPYSRADAYKTWKEADGEWDIMDYVKGAFWDEDHPEDYWLPINCVPPALAVIAPFAYFNVPVAYPMWNAVVGLLLAGQVVAVAKLMRVPVWSTPSLVMVVLTILLDPLHTGLCNGQPAVPAVALTVLAVWLAVANRQLAAGVVLAVATSLKPQLAGPFVLLFLWQRRFKAIATAAVVGAALTLAAVVPLTARHVPWLTGPASWTEEVKFAEVPGGINDARKADIGRHDMVHLQVLTHFVSDNATVAGVLALLIVAGLGYLLWRTARGRPFDLATIAAFTILALLVAYHRLYDAGIVVLPMAWAVLHCRRGVARWPARVILLLCCVYFVQQEWIDERFFGAADRPALSKAWWFDLFVEPHHQWELLAMFVCLVLSLRWQQSATDEPATAETVGFPVVMPAAVSPA